MAKSFKHPTREQWLNASVVAIEAAIFKPLGKKMPKKWRITCSWPSRRALSKTKRTIGQCWSPSASKDSTVELIASLYLDNPLEVLATNVHEMVHAIVGNECGHKGPFAKLARECGLAGKLTATTAGPELEATLKGVLKALGNYPHAALDGVTGIKKQTTRMIKCVCPESGYVCRTTAKWIDEMGAPISPATGEPMEVC
jgi:hypothetical protein